MRWGSKITDMSKLATPNGNDIVCQDVRRKVEAGLKAAYNLATKELGPFEAVVIRLQSGGYNLQLHMDPDKTFLRERISSSSPVPDFNRVVRRRLSH